MAVTLDEDDPCATARALEQAYADLVGGLTAQVVTHRGGPGGVETSVTYNRADPARLLMLVRDWQGRCAAAQGGGRPRRFAMRTGGRC